MRFAIIEAGKVVNIAEATPQHGEAQGWTPLPNDTVGIGWAYSRGKFKAPPPPPVDMDSVRARRDTLLRFSDWTQVPDAPLTDKKREAWREYRAALRDLPATIKKGATSVEWPQPPK